MPRNGRRVYDMRDVIDVVVDQSSWFEVQPDFGKSVVTALAHLGGHPVAVIANQPQVLAGSIDVDGADKASHFITVADSFHLPLVFLADNPGVLPGTRVGAARHPAQRRAHVRGADDGDGTEVRGHAAQGVRLRLDGDGHDRLRQPVGRVRVPGRHDGRDGRGGDEPVARVRRRRGRAAARRWSSRRRTARRRAFGFDELIDPREIRNVLLHSLERALYQRQVAAEPVGARGDHALSGYVSLRASADRARWLIGVVVAERLGRIAHVVTSSVPRRSITTVKRSAGEHEEPVQVAGHCAR